MIYLGLVAARLSALEAKTVLQRDMLLYVQSSKRSDSFDFDGDFRG